jgi:hypothetical protein
MTQTPERETAQIIPFPARPRRAKPALREPGRARSEDRITLPTCDFGSGWYHDAAVQEDLRKAPPRN